MSKAEIITAIRSVFGKRRVPEEPVPNLSPEVAAVLAEWTEHLHNPPKDALANFVWTEEMERELEEGRRQIPMARPIEEFQADIRAGKYRNEGL